MYLIGHILVANEYGITPFSPLARLQDRVPDWLVRSTSISMIDLILNRGSPPLITI